MVSAVNTNTFANKKPNLLGSDTHAADLTGDAELVDDNASANTYSGGSTSSAPGDLNFSLFNDDVDMYSFNATTPSDPSMMVIFFAFCQGNGNGGQVTLRDDTNSDQIAVFSFGSGSVNGVALSTSTIVYETPASGTNTYVLKNTSGGQVTGYLTHIRTKFISLDDTHAASLTGANTQTTKNSNIIGG